MKDIGISLISSLVFIIMVLPGNSCSVGSTSNRADTIRQEKYTVDELQADFRQFRQFLEESHPCLYCFTAKSEFDSLFEAHYQMIKQPMNLQEFYCVLIPLVAKVGCGHTSLWTPQGYWDTAPQKMFPLGVYARDGQLFVIHSYHRESPVKYGSRIVSVNGQNADRIVNDMLGNIWSDGFIMTKRYKRLNNVFPYLYALLYDFPEKFEMEVLEDGKERNITMKTVTRQVMDAYNDSLFAGGGAETSDLWMKLVYEDIALITIGTFAYYDDNAGFNRFIDSSFQVISDRNVRHLIIDLRGNDGGDPFCSSHLLSYLQKKPVVYFRNPYGKYARLNKPLPMAENHFTGHQYYLIDGMCFSTTGHFTSLLKYYELGTFIGEETGATYACNDASHDTNLKYTGYRLQSARRTFATAVTGFPRDQGIIPEHPVTQTIDEVIRGHDAMLHYALDLINTRK